MRNAKKIKKSWTCSYNCQLVCPPSYELLTLIFFYLLDERKESEKIAPSVRQYHSAELNLQLMFFDFIFVACAGNWSD